MFYAIYQKLPKKKVHPIAKLWLLLDSIGYSGSLVSSLLENGVPQRRKYATLIRYSDR